MKKISYSSSALCKITELALVGYKSNIGAYSPLRTFFMRNISMHSHFMVKLERDIYGCAGSLCYLSTNPFQLCHHHLVVIGKASLKYIGALLVLNRIQYLQNFFKISQFYLKTLKIQEVLI